MWYRSRSPDIFLGTTRGLEDSLREYLTAETLVFTLVSSARRDFTDWRSLASSDPVVITESICVAVNTINIRDTRNKPTNKTLKAVYYLIVGPKKS